MTFRRYRELFRDHPSVVAYWSSMAATMTAAATILVAYGEFLMSAFAVVVALYAVGVVGAINRYGKGTPMNVVAVLRSMIGRRFERDTE